MTRMSKPQVPQNNSGTSVAAMGIIGHMNDKPPIDGIFVEDGANYKYFINEDEPDPEKKWIKRRVGINGNVIGRKRIKIKKVQLSFAVDPDFKSTLEDYCQKIETPLSHVVAKAVKEYLDRNPVT